MVHRHGDQPGAADPAVACPAIYGTVNNTVELPGEFGTETSYNVDVNGIIVEFSTDPTVVHVPPMEPPPIEDVRMEVPAGEGSADLVVKYGLPNSCWELYDSDMSVAARSGESPRLSFHAVMYIARIDHPHLGGTGIYRTDEIRFPVHQLERSFFVPCKTYPVLVNGEVWEVPAESEGRFCENAVQAEPVPEYPPEGVVLEPAPIETVGIWMHAPCPEAHLTLSTGLLDDCDQAVRVNIEREGDIFLAEVTVEKHLQPGQECSGENVSVMVEWPLPGEVEAWRVYEVNLNDVTYPLQAVGPNVRCAAPTTGTPIDRDAFEREPEPIELRSSDNDPTRYTFDVEFGPSQRLCRTMGAAGGARVVPAADTSWTWLCPPTKEWSARSSTAQPRTTSISAEGSGRASSMPFQ